MVYLVYAPGFSYAMEKEFPDHFRLTEQLFAVSVDDEIDCEELANRVGLHFESGQPIFVTDPRDSSWRLRGYADEQFRDFLAKHAADSGEVY